MDQNRESENQSCEPTVSVSLEHQNEDRGKVAVQHHQGGGLRKPGNIPPNETPRSRKEHLNWERRKRMRQNFLH